MIPEHIHRAPGPDVAHGLDETAEIAKYQGHSVLMLEDDDTFSMILSDYLRSHGFQVDHVPSGAEGLKKLLATDYDVIVCDMIMPGFPGDMFYLAVSRTKPQLLKRFIFMTGHQGDRKIDQFIRSIRGVMLLKPFQFHEIMTRIDSVLARSTSVPARTAA